MLHALSAAGSGRDIWWLHTTRNRETQAFATEVTALIESLPHARQRVFYTQTDGRMDQRSIAALNLPADATAYLCGPTQFMTDMRDALTAVGLDPARIHSELFGALPPINPGVVDTGQHTPPHPPRRSAGHWTIDHIFAQRAYGQLVTRLRQHSRPGRSVRRANPIRVPKRGLPRVRHRRCRRTNNVCPVTAGATRAGNGADLLGSSENRPGAGSLAR